MYFEKIMNSMRRETARTHAPAFRIEADAANWRIFDGDRQLACFMPLALDIWAFSPFEPDVIANPDPPGKVVDLHTVHNTFLNFGMQGWPKHWNPADLRWSWEKDMGEELIAKITLSAKEGETACWRLKVSYDPSWGRYRYQFAIDARKMDSDAVEGFNLMTAGALEDRPEKRRWTHSVWENADGKLRRIVHSNALFQCTDFGGMRNGGGPWRGRHLPYPKAWMAYAAHPTFNPAVLIHRTTVPLQAATCSQLFDEHIVWSCAGQDNLGEDGYFHYHMELEFVNLPPALAGELLEQAADPVHPKKWWNETVALPFHMDIENSFETAVDPWQPEECPILELPLADKSAVCWCDDTAHSGTHSIRLSQKEKGRLQVFPTGSVCKVKSNTKYRLSAWVKTEQVVGAAKIELAGFAYTYNNISHKGASCELRNNSDWIRLEVELDSGEQAYLMPYLVLEGAGTAWFDDVRLAKAL
ncbi:MAG: hypothetical protein WC637_10660 [Victivallales bacterium]|jgi:hypothetical protein